MKEEESLVLLENEMKKSYLDYAMSVIVGRALPDVRDGLKPVQRRILYAMQGLNLTSGRPHRKSARLVGEVLGKYHPHGDMAVYDALVRMAQDFSLRYPLVDGQGNFGSIDGDPAAAMRYTEIRLEAISHELLNDLDKETVGFIPNFDNSLQEPTVLPAQFPNLLVNGASGIAVGMTTNIPPHNLGEIVDACLALIHNPDMSSEALAELIQGPDFPTGGIIIESEGLKTAYTRGKGKIIIRGKASIERDEGHERIIIEEIPYQVNKTRLIENIAELAQNERIQGIKDIRDESDRHGIRIVVEISRAFTSEIILNQLYKHTALQTTFGIILLALVGGRPRQLSLADAIRHYLEFRQEVTVRRVKFLLEKEEKKAHILQGLQIALTNLDKVIEVIKTASNPQEAHAQLIANFSLSEIQAKSILNMRLQRLTNTEREMVETDYRQSQQNITEFREILDNDAKVWEIIKNELIRVKDRYSNPRRTQIMPEWFDTTNFAPEDLIEKEDIIVTLTLNGYIKYTLWRAYKKQQRGGKGVRSIILGKGDQTQDVFLCNTHSTLLFFTESGKVHAAKAYEIPQRRRDERGRAIINFLQLGDDRIITIIPVDEFQDHEFLLIVTKEGIIKKTNVGTYSAVRRGGIRAIRLRESDSLVKVLLTSGENEVVMATRNGMSIRFLEKDTRPLGRVSTGVKGISLASGDEVVDAVLVDETADLLTVTTHGYGKRTSFSQHRRIRRGGKGVKNIRLQQRKGTVVAIRPVHEDDEILLLTKKGKSVRVQAHNIPRTGRIASGCRIINVFSNDQVIGIA